MKALFVYLLIAICPLVAQSARYGCYSGTIPGCKCTSGPSAGDYVYKSTLQCTDSVGPAEDFGVSLWRTGGYYFDNFVVEGYPNARLPDRPFVAQTVIKRVIIRDSKQLEAFGSGAEPGVSLFTNLTPGLATLIIANCPSIREQEWPSIAKQLAGQRGVNSTDMDVIGLQHLVVVNSKLDDISLIQDLAPNLETLSLRNTGITSVKHDFRPYSRLRVLDLSDTPGLKRFAITGQLSPTLHNVLLNNCDLRTFNLATLEQLTMVDFVALAGNKLNCECSYLPADFVNNANAKRFLGSLCAAPEQTSGMTYGGACIMYPNMSPVGQLLVSGLRKTRGNNGALDGPQNEIHLNEF